MKQYSEDDLLPISALQHLLFCERQCALIHIEQQWQENRFTAEGRILHDRVHQSGTESRGKVRITHDLPLRSLSLGLSGKADVVEFHQLDDGGWRPYPVEYKRGRPKKENWDQVQLCAQALCLEEMLETEVEEGALFYGEKRRRQIVAIDPALRAITVETAKRLHDLMAAGLTPLPVYLAGRCKNCSFLSVCLPKKMSRRGSVADYLAKMTDKP